MSQDLKKYFLHRRLDVVGDKPDACMIQVDKSAIQGQGCQYA